MARLTLYGCALLTAMLGPVLGPDRMGEASPLPGIVDACPATGKDNATVLIPTGANLTLRGRVMEPGTVIAALTPSGACAGYVAWTGAATALTLWMDDPMTPELDGYRPGEPIRFIAVTGPGPHDGPTGAEYRHVCVTYAPAPGPPHLARGTFEPGAVYRLTSLYARKG